jgi:RNase P subunit RPR2
MDECHHKNLVILPHEEKKLQCRHCHLVIARNELEDGFCPECYEVLGKKVYDFTPVIEAKKAAVRYRCEDCGAIFSQ